MNWTYTNISFGTFIFIVGLFSLSLRTRNPLMGELFVTWFLIFGGLAFVLANALFRDTNDKTTDKRFYISVSIFSVILLIMLYSVTFMTSLKLLN